MAEKVHQIDSTIDIVTPENIAFNYRVAGPFRRLLAFLIDFALRVIVMVGILVLFVLIGAWLGFAFSSALSAFMFAMWVVLLFVSGWFYGGLFETFWNGQTPGKWLLGIRVLSTNGSPINGFQAVLRNILREADLMPAFPLMLLFGPDAPPWSILPTFMVGLITMTLTKRFQRLGDLVCQTLVVVEERSWLLGVAKLEDPRAAQLAAYLPPNYVVSRSLSGALAIYVERRRFFSRARRREIARHLAEPLLLEFELPADTSHDLLLCALYYRVFIAEVGDDRQLGINPFGSETAVEQADQVAPTVAPPLPQEQMVTIGSKPQSHEPT